MVVTGVRVLIRLDRDWLLINQLHSRQHSLNTKITTPPRASQTQQWRGLQTDATVAHPNLNLLYIFCFGLSRCRQAQQTISGEWLSATMDDDDRRECIRQIVLPAIFSRFCEKIILPVEIVLQSIDISAVKQ